MKHTYLLILFMSLFFTANAQKYMTKNGYIGLFSHTPLEDIKADNNQVASVLDLSTGEIVIQVLVKSFQFQKTLMQEHFNENYLESDKFPRATFSGKIVDFPSYDLSKNGNYDIKVEGDLSIHGVTKKVISKGTLEISAGGINANSKFIVVPEDYKITIPSVVRNNIAKTIEVTVTMKYTPLENK